MVEIPNRRNLNAENSENQKVNNVRRTIQDQIIELLPMVTDSIILLIQVLYYSVISIIRLIFPNPPKSVEGEIVLVTGAGHGIGKELAITYASAGATVVCWDINAENNHKTVNEIKSLGYEKAYSFTCDVSKRDNVLQTAKHVKEQVGDVTILINNAGIMPTHLLEDHTAEEIQRIMNINVMAHFWTIEAFLPAMKKNNHGHLVALSSIAGVLGLVNLVPYCASKYAVRGLMETISEELRLNPRNQIRTTTICPYMVNTGLCKRPVIKFKKLMALLEPKNVAKEIMDAQRSNVVEITLPGYLMKVNYVARLLPYDAMLKVRDFFSSGVESDLK